MFPPKIMSANRNPNLGPSQMRAKRRRLFFVRSSIILFFLLVIIFGIAILSGHENVRIQTVTVSGNAAVPTDDILALVNADLAGRYFSLFSKSNSIIFPRFQIKKDLLKKIMTIQDADVSWEGWQKISITVTERKPYSVWCGTNPLAVEPDCYFADKTGYIYSQAPSFSGNIYVKNYSNLYDTDPLGQYFLPKGLYTRISNLLSALEQNNLKVISLSYDGFDFKFVLEVGPTIIFNGESDYNQAFSNLLSAIETNNLDLNKDAGNISYIDLRYDNKIIVGKKDMKVKDASQI